MRYLLDELHCYENDHSDALGPASQEATLSLAGEAALAHPETTEELRTVHVSINAGMQRLETTIAGDLRQTLSDMGNRIQSLADRVDRSPQCCSPLAVTQPSACPPVAATLTGSKWKFSVLHFVPRCMLPRSDLGSSLNRWRTAPFPTAVVCCSSGALLANDNPQCSTPEHKHQVPLAAPLPSLTRTKDHHWSHATHQRAGNSRHTGQASRRDKDTKGGGLEGHHSALDGGRATPRPGQTPQGLVSVRSSWAQPPIEGQASQPRHDRNRIP